MTSRWSWVLGGSLLVVMLVACIGDRDERSAAPGATPVSEETIRDLVAEAVASALPTAAIRQLTREEVERALAAREVATSTCAIGTAAARALPSVVQVQVRQPGTAIVTGQGILTAAHVVGESNSVTIVTADGRELPAAVIKADAVLDLAVLRVAERGLPPVRWAEPSAVALGEPVRIVGFASGRPGITVTGGVLTNRRTGALGGRDEVITDADADPGNSGGPVLTACGEALGVAVRRQPFCHHDRNGRRKRGDSAALRPRRRAAGAANRHSSRNDDSMIAGRAWRRVQAGTGYLILLPLRA
jgi:S1-C subfamily serine protease